MAERGLSRVPAPVGGLLALGAGGLQALSLAPEPRGVLQVLGAALLEALVMQAAPRRAFVLGALAGVAWLAGTFWWLFISMHRYGHLPAWLAAGAVLALAAALSLYLAGAMALFARWRGRGGFGRDYDLVIDYGPWMKVTARHSSFCDECGGRGCADVQACRISRRSATRLWSGAHPALQRRGVRGKQFVVQRH